MKLLVVLILTVLSNLGFSSTFEISDPNKTAVLVGEFYEVKANKEIDLFNALANIKKGEYNTHSKVQRKFSSYPLWYLISVENKSDQDVNHLLQYPFVCTDTMETYRLNEKNEVIEKHFARHNQKLEDRKVRVRRLSSPLVFKANSTSRLLIKVESRHILGMLFEFHTLEHALNHEDRYKIASILYIGITIGLFLFNIFMAITDRNKLTFSYVFLIFSVSSLIVVVADLPVYFGVSIPFIFHYLLPFQHLLLIISTSLFGVIFLNTKGNFPRIHNSYITIVVFGVISFSLTFFSSTYGLANTLITNILTALMLVSIFSSLYIYISHRERASLIYLIANSFLFTSGIVYMLVWNYGMFERNFFTDNILLLGSAIEMILFAIAVAENIKQRIINAENSLRNLNQELENKVEEKTSQLLSAKSRIALGELAAQVTHEINSPLSAAYNHNQRIESVMKKDIVDNEKILRSTGKINNLLKEVFTITDNLQVFVNSFGDHSIEKIMLKDIISMALEKNYGFDYQEHIEVVGNNIILNSKKAPLVNALASIIKYTSSSNSNVKIVINKISEKLITIDFITFENEYKEWISAIVNGSRDEISGVNKGSGFDLTIALEYFSHIDSSVEYSKDDYFRFKINLNITKLV